jgi:hypothetical protein
MPNLPFDQDVLENLSHFCPKCRHVGEPLVHYRRDERRQPSEAEWLEIACARCGYDFPMEVADADAS